MARRSNTTTSVPPPANLTLQQMRRGVELLKRRLSDLDTFDVSTVQAEGAPQVRALETSIEETLSRVFGQGTQEYIRYLPASNIEPPRVVFAGNRPAAIETQQKISRGLERAKASMMQAIRGLSEEIEDSDGTTSETNALEARSPSRRVFVVHGRDNEAKIEVARFLSKIDLEEIILHERPNAGRHLLTKFQDEAKGASFAVVLITPDDIGGSVGQAQRNRARQNVIFELGFFIGVFGPSGVAALVKGDVETPSDFDGIAYIPMDTNGAWKSLLARELHAAEVPFNPSKVFSA